MRIHEYMYMTFTFLSVASVGPKSALLGEYKCIQRLSMMTSCYIHSSLFIILLHCTYIYILKQNIVRNKSYRSMKMSRNIFRAGF